MGLLSKACGYLKTISRQFNSPYLRQTLSKNGK